MPNSEIYIYLYSYIPSYTVRLNVGILLVYCVHILAMLYKSNLAGDGWCMWKGKAKVTASKSLNSFISSIIYLFTFISGAFLQLALFYMYNKQSFKAFKDYIMKLLLVNSPFIPPL